MQKLTGDGGHAYYMDAEVKRGDHRHVYYMDAEVTENYQLIES